MAAVATMPVSNGSLPLDDAEFPNTLPDPRSPSPTPRLRSPASETDLSGEVAMLSTKLINAINHTTSLDDSLQQNRHELEAARRRVQELEQAASAHAKDITDGVLVKKAEVDANMQQLRNELEQARHEREASDKAKKQMELEVESLTASLFEQANTMVADARRENEAAEKKNTQLRSQLQDTETLLASQQEQLHDLKSVMEKMSSERDETETAPHLSTAPSTPITDANKMSRILDTIPMSPGHMGDSQPDHPLRFSHLLTPIVRTDTQSYNDFAELIKTSRAINQITHVRNSSGSLTSIRSPGTLASNPAASSSSPNLPGSFNAPITPSITSPRDPVSSPLPPLKDSRFYKRSLTEDIEPTLRLDLAPGLSWLARRTVLTSITTGALVIEPFATNSKLYGPVYACALCGEDRRQDIYARRHRFRTSEDTSAQRYPLCEYCLNRVRATCDFAAFLRMCRDGTWKAANDEEIRGAWEEGVRLREKMFWTRVGGGVVPTASHSGKEAGSGAHTHGKTSEETTRRRGSESSDTHVGADATDEPDQLSGQVAKDLDGDKIVLLQAPGKNRPAVKLETPPQQIRKDPFDSTAGETRVEDQENNDVDTGLTPITEKRTSQADIPVVSSES